ncbi:hypothetical protein H4R18_005274 [Coemansia javaensis]|uniref:Peptide hydrolase n=1 Tax=Coemansia javaensis TaxID=2761396 RepID=A0A9W8H5I3_9FUNG|nr:hypothetical protein H4R18_005274 [Coemansia javaensis]
MGSAGAARALAAVALQAAALAALALLMAASLKPGSAASRLLGRDAPAHPPAAGALAGGQTAFDVQRALGDLEAIARAPHSLNDQRSIGVRDYLRAAIGDAIQGSDAEFCDPLGNGTAATFKANGIHVYWEDSSLAVRVPGSGNGSEALLVQAHYDAVPMSRGAYDDGVGVAVCLELVRSLARQPTRHPVVVNIDWGEENGLYGAMLFARFHPWADAVRAYINLEAGGVGGRAAVFRASHPALLRAYRQAVPRPHAMPVGSDALKMGLVKSATDYGVYTTRYGIPGLDMAFIDHRSIYHTARDSPQRATTESVLSMGAAALDTARHIADSAWILPSIPRAARLPPRPQPPAARSPQGRLAADEAFGDAREMLSIPDMRHVVVTRLPPAADNAVEDALFYDVLSRAMVVRSYVAELWINILTGIAGIAIVVASQYPFARPLPSTAAEWTTATPAERLVMQLGRGGFFGALLRALAAHAKAYASALFGSLVFTGTLLSLVTPRLAYTHPALYMLLLLSAAALSATCVLSAWAVRARLTDAQAMSWYALCVFRCAVLLAVVVPLNWAGIGVLYREQIYAWAAIGGTLLTALMDPDTTMGGAWRRQIAALAIRLPSRRRPSGEQLERLLDHDELDRAATSNSNGAPADPAPARHSDCASSVAVAHHVLSALRLLVSVVVPLTIGMDATLRQLVALKDHFVDGMPPIVCTAVAALDIATFVVLLAPFIVGVLADADSHWLVRSAGAVVEPWLRLLFAPRSRGTRGAGDAPAPSRSHISLHTSYGTGDSDPEPSDAEIDAGSDAAPRVLDYSGDGDGDGDNSDGERVIVLDSGGRRQSMGAAAAAAAPTEHSGGAPGRPRPAAARPRKGESPETIGLWMTYAWTGAWLLLWIAIQLAMLAGESYNDGTEPLKVRVLHSTRISAECLQGGSGPCSRSQLSLASPDSAGLARLVEAVAPSEPSLVCFTQNVRGFYKCIVSSEGDRRTADAEWSPESAINITSIQHTTAFSSRGTLFVATVAFSAPETRTCFVDLGSHPGHSLQSYPNPHPVPPPLAPPPPQGPGAAAPVIARTVLPVIERARFVGAAAPDGLAQVSEPITDRDPVFSGRILAHKQSFDDGGRFTAEVQYLLPAVNATRPAGIKIDISCYFDQAERHTPLLAPVLAASPGWAVFTPAANVLSTVTIAGVAI